MSSTAADPITLAETCSTAECIAKPRRITPQAARALDKLAHAIEYLTDEFVMEQGAPPFRGDGRLRAIELLMNLNRQIYMSCPEEVRLRDRLFKIFR